MMNAKFMFNVESWNVRGLGDSVKCGAVFADLAFAKPSLLGLQETKLSLISPAKAASFLPPNLRTFSSVDSIGSSGGLVTAWDQTLFSLATSGSTRSILSLDFLLADDGSPFRFTNVYAPCDLAGKTVFLQDLLTHAPIDNTPWLIAGDFNLTRDPSDHNNDNFSLPEAELFNDCINTTGLIELPLGDRRLSCLGAPFTYTEIREAFSAMNKMSSPGPDGFGPSFFSTFWDTVSADVAKIFSSFFDGTIDLSRINRAFLAITKVLMTRLKAGIHNLVDADQTGFLSGRRISENIVYAADLVRCCHTRKSPTIVFKIDFRKAFDSVNWASLLPILRARGFDDLWCTWMWRILDSGHTAILLNGVP
ncbi:hypothetical protein QYE76_001431 [Lolium multiflorum]|uniref:Reverse transcriptase domain-containing protein n=1 Tax=Lolium multiflorum TaxID=4521 RepID=A0AAD8RNR6_LOLMU|nr:hypothetical protein QYE76_001431 [Lolium multiflorum]